MSYKKKQQCYIMGRSTHHHTNRPQNMNKRTRHNTPPSSTKWEKRSQEAANTRTVVTNTVSRRSRNPLQV
jgi:hypothetical protein